MAIVSVSLEYKNMRISKKSLTSRGPGVVIKKRAFRSCNGIHAALLHLFCLFVKARVNK